MAFTEHTHLCAFSQIQTCRHVGSHPSSSVPPANAGGQPHHPLAGPGALNGWGPRAAQVCRV